MKAVQGLDRVIHIHPLAPHKPELGAACNGCGVCCLLEPCPVGMLLLRRRTGACDLLLWDSHVERYRCGILVDSAQALAQSQALDLAIWRKALSWALKRWGRRWIAAGQGCDCAVDVQK